MKQKIPFIIVFLFLYQSVGYFLIFEIKQIIIREEIKERIERGIPNNQLTLFKVPINAKNHISPELKRVNNSEFKYHGEMYDVVRQYVHGDTIWFYCINDEKETALFLGLDQVVKSQQDNDPDYKNFMLHQQKILSNLYDFNIFNYNLFNYNVLIKWLEPNIHYLNIFLDPLKLPPELSLL